MLALLAASGCSGDESEPQTDPALERETVQSITSPGKIENLPPGQTGLPNTTMQLTPPVKPDGGEASTPNLVFVEPTPPKPQRKFFRPSYKRSEHDPERLARFRLSRYSTTRLELITDLPREQAEPLVPLVDLLQPFLEDYFGKLPPARDGSDYRVTGFVMANRNRFVQAGLAKEAVIASFHGRQIGAEFWMNNQTLDYYRRHLLLHESVHCFMRHLPGESGFPMWYLEGMAEMIATHHRAVDEPQTPRAQAPPPEYTFNVMPADRMRFRGLERIVILQRDVRKNGVRSIRQIRGLTADDFRNSIEPYAWCWALCRFLDSHPTTQRKFRQLAASFVESPPAAAINSFFRAADPHLETEWALFAANIEHGYEFKPHAIVFQEGRPLDSDSHVARVQSNQSWQPTRLQVEAGVTYHIAAAGQFTLAQGERPWLSEANGVSIRYHKGQPLGRLLGAILVEGKPHTMLQTIPLGNDSTFTARQTGTLYLRVNDWPDSLSDNRGMLSVTVRNAASKAEAD